MTKNDSEQFFHISNLSALRSYQKHECGYICVRPSILRKLWPQREVLRIEFKVKVTTRTTQLDSLKWEVSAWKSQPKTLNLTASHFESLGLGASAWQPQLGAGGKPSTRFLPGRLVELSLWIFDPILKIDHLIHFKFSKSNFKFENFALMTFA